MKRSFTGRHFVSYLCIMLLLSVLLCGCKSREAVATDKLFEQLDIDAPDGEILAMAQDAYEKLSSEDRETLEHYEQFVQAESNFKAGEVDALIDSIGTVTLESGETIESARKAYDALEKTVRDLVTQADILTAAENRYHELIVEQAAGDIDGLIKAIGKVTLDDRTPISVARSAFDEAKEEIKAAVQLLPELEKAEELYHRLEVEHAAEEIDALIDAIGDVTLDSGELIEAARSAYDLADEEIKAEVGQLSVLTEAEETLVFLGKKAKAEEIDALITALGTITAESEDEVNRVRDLYENLPEDIRELVTEAAMIDKAEYTLQGLKDKAAAAEIKELLDKKKYDDAIARAEECIGERKEIDKKGSLIKNTVKAYVSKANALMKEKHYEAAETLLKNCKERFSGADMVEVNKALASLKKAIAEPDNGKVFTSKAKGGYCTLKIKAGDTPVFVKVESTKDPNNYVTIYVRANKSATVHIKNGDYLLKYATGNKWYGSKDLFGSETRYYSADTILEMTTKRSGNYVYYQTFTITLQTVSGGNLTTTSIQQDEF